MATVVPSKISPHPANGRFVVIIVLVYKENTAIDRDITITEPDIDNLVRAKGAMFSAALTLLEEIGMSFKDMCAK